MRTLMSIMAMGMMFCLVQEISAEDWSHGPTWSHVEVKSPDGVRVRIDYVVKRIKAHLASDEMLIAEPLFVNVSGPGIEPGEVSVEAILSSRTACGGHLQPGGGSFPKTFKFPLRWMGTHFSGEIRQAVVNEGDYVYSDYQPLILYSTNRAGEFHFLQNLAVRVGNRLIKADQHRDFDLNLQKDANPVSN